MATSNDETTLPNTGQEPILTFANGQPKSIMATKTIDKPTVVTEEVDMRDNAEESSRCDPPASPSVAEPKSLPSDVVTYTRRRWLLDRLVESRRPGY